MLLQKLKRTLDGTAVHPQDAGNSQPAPAYNSRMHRVNALQAGDQVPHGLVCRIHRLPVFMLERVVRTAYCLGEVAAMDVEQICISH